MNSGDSPLAHDVFGPEGGAPTILIAHGILGSRRNWRSFARQLQGRMPTSTVITLDLRAHGDSRDLPGEDTLNMCAADVIATFGDVQDPVLVGHSFGGKVMAIAANRWSLPVRQLWVLDSALGDRETSFGATSVAVQEVLRAIQGIPEDHMDREGVRRQLEAASLKPSLVNWILTNVKQTPTGWGWRFDPERVQRLLDDYFRRDLWPQFCQPRVGCDHLLVRGALSERWTVGDQRWLRRAVHERAVTDLQLPAAGHWVHADNPEGLLQLMDEHMWRRDDPIR